MFHVEREQLTHPILDPEELTGLRACYRLMREEARIMQQIDCIFSSVEVFQTEEAWALVDDAERVGLISHPMVRLVSGRLC
ncbi:MAG: uncharacterized protein KVP18_001451 [Porospora cf. gigantea A]|uniref:uncharacterized protein n=1 Tax=Porospora cf. gigantea A TaxID=2853593 RepID=UPI00355A036F|nr:MAG: hypothetical protein KVP18_001451 [Porospora cf. gigantea A]